MNPCGEKAVIQPEEGFHLTVLVEDKAIVFSRKVVRKLGLQQTFQFPAGLNIGLEQAAAEETLRKMSTLSASAASAAGKTDKSVRRLSLSSDSA